MSTTSEPLRLTVDADTTVSALWLRPAQARVAFTFAHGAGAGMTHAFMQAAAEGLARRGIATLRFQFPGMERGSKRPDPPPLAHATVRAAVARLAGLAPTLPRVAAGKSFGGRMSSQAQALAALPGVRGLVFFGFPLHPAGKPSLERAAHLHEVDCPMLFLQGTRDALAEPACLDALEAALAGHGLARFHRIEGADHAFHVPARSGRSDAQVLDELLDTVGAWVDTFG